MIRELISREVVAFFIFSGSGFLFRGFRNFVNVEDLNYTNEI